ncbi:hypothetical protein [Mobiluncus mulieris]|nr:hypothetical protein [Mobiluncus mulieris]
MRRKSRMAPHEPDFYRHIWLRSHFHLESGKAELVDVSLLY